MKTNLVKKGSEKNIEMFKMSNEELVAINGGRFDIGYDEDGNPIVIVRPGVKSFLRSFFNHD
ncbi:MAG: hypothetical protein NTY32_08515 [Bacteroidia bacterium]|nr:hypothetical protein [Bacteroidia bacterium]